MDYEVTMTNEQIQSYTDTHLALEALRDQLYAKIAKDGKDKLHYITTASNTDDGFKITAEYSEERKQHFIDHPLKE